MLADVLTKSMVMMPPYLEYVLSRGRVSLVESDEAQNVLDGLRPLTREFEPLLPLYSVARAGGDLSHECFEVIYPKKSR